MCMHVNAKKFNQFSVKMLKQKYVKSLPTKITKFSVATAKVIQLKLSTQSSILWLRNEQPCVDLHIYTQYN